MYPQILRKTQYFKTEGKEYANIYIDSHPVSDC